MSYLLADIQLRKSGEAKGFVVAERALSLLLILQVALFGSVRCENLVLVSIVFVRNLFKYLHFYGGLL
ncbi:hypothetical protein ACS86_18735 [Vibrio alginolyticus]|nr:hypothetical protein ACS86_18735 [Vibrio alginolyticus]